MNYQNIPRDLKVVKRAFVPKQGALSFFDYAQIEPRLTGYFAAKIGFPEFAEQLRAGVDPYTAVARLVTEKEEVTDEERQTWKRAYLSLLYGGGVKTIQEQFAIPAAQAKAMIKTFHRNWPAVGELQDAVLRAHRRRGYIVGLDGRHLHMEQYGEHKLLNKLIQGSAAAVMSAAVVAVDEWLGQDDLAEAISGVRLRSSRPPKGRGTGIKSHMVSVIHDELILDGPEDELPALHAHVPPLMDVYPEVSEVVPILVDHEVSVTTWADKEPYDEWLQRQTPPGRLDSSREKAASASTSPAGEPTSTATRS